MTKQTKSLFRSARAGAVIAAAFLLSGCYDYEVEVQFLGDGQVLIASEQWMDRDLYDMSTEPMECDGETTLDQEGWTCKTNETVSVEELLERPSLLSIETGKGVTIEQLDDNRIAITYDFADMLEENQNAPSSQEMEGMEELLRPALEDRELIFRISGHAIDETTGSLSEDGKTAEYILPLTTILDEPEVDGFRTVVLTDKPGCFLGLFCR